MLHRPTHAAKKPLPLLRKVAVRAIPLQASLKQYACRQQLQFYANLGVTWQTEVKYNYSMMFEIFMTMSSQIIVFLDVTSCTLVDIQIRIF